MTPRKQRVTVELRRGGRVIKHRGLAVTAGRFAGTIRAPRPGRYALVATTAADADNAPGSSAPVAVTIT